MHYFCYTDNKQIALTKGDLCLSVEREDYINLVSVMKSDLNLRYSIDRLQSISGQITTLN